MVLATPKSVSGYERLQYLQVFIIITISFWYGYIGPKYSECLFCYNAGMKFYVTGRSNNYEKVKEVFKKLKENGHEIVFEWTELPIVKPYNEHADEAASFAKQSVDGMVEADVYIIFAHEDGNGVYTELGSALASNVIKGKPRVLAIGLEVQWSAMFNYHPSIEWFETIEDVYKELEV